MPEIIGASLRFGDKTVLSDFSLSLPETGICALLGPSGCGKTTLLRALCGLVPLDAGEVRGIAGRRCGVVFQEDRLLPWLTCEENLRIVRGNRRDDVRPFLQEVELEREAGSQIGELSGGMRRRLALARCFAYEPDVFFLDEPLKGMDDALRQRMLRLIERHAAGKLAVLVTHDRAEAEQIADVIYTLDGPPLRMLRREHAGQPE